MKNLSGRFQLKVERLEEQEPGLWTELDSIGGAAEWGTATGVRPGAERAPPGERAGERHWVCDGCWEACVCMLVCVRELCVCECVNVCVNV